LLDIYDHGHLNDSDPINKYIIDAPGDLLNKHTCHSCT